MTFRKLRCLLVLQVLLVGCGDEEAAELEREQTALETRAQRSACIGTELLAEAASDYETLRGDPSGSPAEANPVIAQALQASIAFSRAYLQHAEIRQTVYANVDSAYNLATSPSDSVRYVQRADATEISSPEPGTVEANVMDAYNQNFAALAGDPDFPCNWE